MRRMSFALFLIATFAAQAGQVYKWTDAKGRVHYGDRPVTANAEKIEIKAPGPAQEPAANGEAAADLVRQCESKREQLKSYETAVRVIEKDSLGKEKEFTEAERQQLIARVRLQIEQSCSGKPQPETAAQPQTPPPAGNTGGQPSP